MRTYENTLIVRFEKICRKKLEPLQAQADGNIALPTHQPPASGPLTAAEAHRDFLHYGDESNNESIWIQSILTLIIYFNYILISLCTWFCMFLGLESVGLYGALCAICPSRARTLTICTWDLCQKSGQKSCSHASWALKDLKELCYLWG